MARLRQVAAQSVGLREDQQIDVRSLNHYKSAAASESGSISKQASAKGLRRVAGNIFICPSSRDLWSAKGGKIVRLVGIEVDNGESLSGAPANDPGAFLQDALNDLTF